ncbi:SGNH hydrolase-type esterase superfamily protein [Perilla frutescens var. hirtella]|nr:SGNH hydrolase-type esterase superfamily protein [Perilla frutescens var. frutescens]KAH6787098.1 SGNH hydrolase-type esterase superfamily protein [Perilla frutescens var. hirtella]
MRRQDEIHLSSQGSKTLVKEILKVLKRADWEPSLYWLKMPSEFPEDSPYYIVSPDGETTFNAPTQICIWQREWLDI